MFLYGFKMHDAWRNVYASRGKESRTMMWVFKSLV